MSALRYYKTRLAGKAVYLRVIKETANFLIAWQVSRFGDHVSMKHKHIIDKAAVKLIAYKMSNKYGELKPI